MTQTVLSVFSLTLLAAGCSGYPPSPREVGLAFISELERGNCKAAQQYLLIADAKTGLEVESADDKAGLLRRWRGAHSGPALADYARAFRALLVDEQIVPLSEEVRKNAVACEMYPTNVRVAAETEPSRFVMNQRVLWFRGENGQWRIVAPDKAWWAADSGRSEP
jgi:hypothetical protein